MLLQGEHQTNRNCEIIKAWAMRADVCCCLPHAAQNPFALIRVAGQNIDSLSVKRIHDMRRNEVCRFLNLRTIKVAVMEKKAKALLEVAAAALVQSQELLGVQKAELIDIAEEFRVAGSQFEGVGFLATDEFLTSRY